MILEVCITVSILALVGACWLLFKRPRPPVPPVEAAVLDEWEEV